MIFFFFFLVDQLTYLLEGDNGDSGDHVVPYPFQSERNVPSAEGEIINQYDAKASDVKPADRKKTFDFHNIKHDANEALPASVFVVDSWPDLSMSKTNQDFSHALESDNAAGTLGFTSIFCKLDGWILYKYKILKFVLHSLWQMGQVNWTLIPGFFRSWM